MNARASTLSPITVPVASLALLRDALVGHEQKALVLALPEGREVQAGYHVTEVKAGSFVTMDCGGNPDAWQETILQVEDLPVVDGAAAMTVGKFQSIMATVDRAVRLNVDARLTIEVGGPDEPMRVHDVLGVVVEGHRAILRLGARPAICKPRHRPAHAEKCCSPASDAGCCT